MSQPGGAEAVPTKQRLSRPSLVHYATLLGGGIFLLIVASGGWFWADEWQWLGRGPFVTTQMLFTPYGCHCYAVAALVYRTLFYTFGTRSYLPYAGTVVLLQIGAAHLLWRIQIRNGIRPWVATASIPLFLFFGAGWEDVFWGVMVAFSGALLGSLATIWLVDRETLSRRRQVLAWTTCVLALGCGCVGLTGLFASALVSWYQRGTRALLVMISIPLTIYMVWFATWGYAGATGLPGQASPSFFKDMPGFALRLLVTTFADLVGSQIFGAVLLGALVLALLWRPLSRMKLSFTPVIMAVATLFLNITVAYGHVNGGNPTDSRYTDLDMAFMLPVIGLLLNEIRARYLGWIALASICGITLRGAILDVAEADALHKIEARAETHALIAAYTSDPRAFQYASPDPNPLSGAPLSELQWLRDQGELGPLPSVSTDDLNDTLTMLHIYVSQDKPGRDSNAHFKVISGAFNTSENCVTTAGTSGQRQLLLVQSTGTIRVTPATPDIIEVLVKLPSSPEALEHVAIELLPPNVPAYITVSTPGMTIALDGVDRETRIC